MEPGTALAILGPSAVVLKILGPTADYVGEGLKSWTQKRVQNVQRIFANAERKLGPALEEPGGVSPRVLKEIFDEGSYSDDALAADYFGGVLASSRSGISRDDRGAYVASLISRLSTYQLRTHYIFYRAARDLLKMRGVSGADLMRSEVRDNEGTILLPLYVYEDAMGFESGEDQNSIYVHAATGILGEGLIGDTWAMGDREIIGRVIDYAPDISGVVFTITLLGMELFVWAHGAGELGPAFTADDPRLAENIGVTLRPGTMNRPVIQHEYGPKSSG